MIKKNLHYSKEFLISDKEINSVLKRNKEIDKRPSFMSFIRSTFVSNATLSGKSFMNAICAEKSGKKVSE